MAGVVPTGTIPPRQVLASRPASNTATSTSARSVQSDEEVTRAEKAKVQAVLDSEKKFLRENPAIAHENTARWETAEKRIRLAQQILNKKKYNPRTSFDDAALRLRLQDPSLSQNQARQRVARYTGDTYKSDPNARESLSQAREELADERALRNAARAEEKETPTYYEVVDAEGKRWRSNNPDFIKEKTGVDVTKLKRDTVVLRDSKGNVFYGKAVTVNGKTSVLGVRQKAEGELTKVAVKKETVKAGPPPPPPTPAFEPPTSPAAKSPSYTSLEGGDYGTNITIEKSDTAWSVPMKLPPATLTATEYDEGYTITPLAGLPLKLTTRRGDELSQKGKDLFSRGVQNIKASEYGYGDTGKGAVQVAKGLAWQFAGGARQGTQYFIENPKEAAVTVASYAVAAELGGPAGVAGLFALENMEQAAAGEETSIQYILRDPVTAAGQALPFTIATGAVEATPRAVKATAPKVEAAARNFFDVNKYLNEVATTENVKSLQPFSKEVSVDLTVEPIYGELQFGRQQARGGAVASELVRVQKKGAPQTVTYQELLKAPKDYVWEANIDVTQTVAPESGTTTLGEVSAPAQTATLNAKASGLTTAKKIAATDTTFSIGVDTANLNAPLKGSLTYTADVDFKPIKLAKSKEVVPTAKETTGKATRPEQLTDVGRSVEYRPSVDYFEKVLEVKGEGSDFTVTKSFATGETTTKGVLMPKPKVTDYPAIIKGVSYKPKDIAKTTKATTKPTVKPAPKFVEVTQPDGTIILTEVKTEQTTKKQELKLKEEEKTKSEEKKKAQSESKSYSYVEVQEPVLKTGSYAESGAKLSAAEKAAARARFKIVPVSIEKEKALSKLRPKTASGVKESADATTDLKFQPATITDVTTTTTTQQDTTTEQNQDQITFLKIPEPKTPRERIPRPTEGETTIITPPKKPKGDDKRKKRAFFDVLVRRGGEFQKVNVEGLGLESAFKRGRAVVESTAAASFKIEPRGESGFPVTSGASRFLPKSIYRQSKRERGVFVQRREKRISSAGEKREITFKGLFGKSKKKSNWSLGKKKKNRWF